MNIGSKNKYMAQKRMFSLQIVDTDAFLDMPTSSQLLYFHLVMRADDEGFIGNPKKIMRLVGIQEDDLKILLAKRFLLTFESGVVVVKHWLIHNNIRMDRFNETTYQDEKKLLKLNENKSYTEMATKWQPNGNHLEPQVKLSEVNLIKVNLSESGASAPTPAQVAKEFFNNEEKRRELGITLAEKHNTDIRFVAEEIRKFTRHWTEPNKSGSKQRWEQQPTFEVSRRLEKWFANIKQFNKTNEKKGVSI